MLLSTLYSPTICVLLSVWYQRVSTWHGVKKCYAQEASIYDGMVPIPLQKETNSSKCLHLGRKLFQQFIVDEFERHQTWELWWFRNNQKTIRAELYDNLHANRAGGRTLESTGRVMILPATYTCSDRWYHCRYKNSMVVVRVKGPPSLSLFIYDSHHGCQL